MARHVHKHGFRFAQIPDELIYSEVSGRAIKIFGALLRHGEDPSNCHPSHKRLGIKCHMSIPSVRRAIAELVTTGWVVIEARYKDDGSGQTSNGYHIYDAPLIKYDTPPLIKYDTPPCSPVINEGEQWNDSQLNDISSSRSNLSNNAVEPPEKPDEDDELITYATQQATRITRQLNKHHYPTMGMIQLTIEATQNGWTPNDFDRLAMAANDYAETPYPYYMTSLRAGAGDLPPRSDQLDLTL